MTKVTNEQLRLACNTYAAVSRFGAAECEAMRVALQSFADSLPRFELTADERLVVEAWSARPYRVALLDIIDRAQGMPLAGHLADYVETLESANRDLAGAEARAEAAEARARELFDAHVKLTHELGHRLTSEERQHLELVRDLLKSPEPLGNVSASALLAIIDRLAPLESPAPVPAKRSAVEELLSEMERCRQLRNQGEST